MGHRTLHLLLQGCTRHSACYRLPSGHNPLSRLAECAYPRVHALHICNEPVLQLDGLLRARSASLRGIVNGIDYKVFDPSTDKKIFAQFDAKSAKKQKAINKEKLQAVLGLPVDKDKYMIAIISRLTDQKGLDLVNYAIERICDENTQFVIIGTGEQRYENMFRHYQWKYPDRVSANICYSDELAHKLYAAADTMLMPSLFEPCGLTQLIALRYGTIPIVRETGGLKDTVVPYNEFDGSGTGFSFANYNGDEMLGAINYSKAVYYDAFINPEDGTNVRTTAKELMIPEKQFIRFLTENGYLYRAPSGKLMPYAVQGNVHLFIVRDFYNNGFVGSYTLITPAGKELFRSLREKILEVE